MELYEARNELHAALTGKAQEVFTGMSEADRNEFAQPLAYGKKTLSECVAEFEAYCADDEPTE